MSKIESFLKQKAFLKSVLLLLKCQLCSFSQKGSLRSVSDCKNFPGNHSPFVTASNYPVEGIVAASSQLLNLRPL